MIAWNSLSASLRPILVVLARVLSPAVSQIRLATRRADAAERRGQELRERHRLGVLQHRDQHAQLDAVGMRLDLLGLGRQLVGRARVDPFVGRLAALGIEVVQRDVRIGDRRLLQVLVDAAAAADEAAFELDRHARAVIQLDPLDAVLLDVLAARVAGRNVFALALPLRISGRLRLGVDLDFVVVGRLALARPWRRSSPACRSSARRTCRRR